MMQLEYMNEPQITNLMAKMARAVKETAKGLDVEEPLFGLIVYNDPKLAQYVGNGTRESMVKAIRETADKMEKADSDRSVHRIPFPEPPSWKEAFLTSAWHLYGDYAVSKDQVACMARLHFMGWGESLSIVRGKEAFHALVDEHPEMKNPAWVPDSSWEWWRKENQVKGPAK